MSSSSSSSSETPRKSTWRVFLREEVSSEWGDAVLILGCLATGLLDAAVFNVWSCFVSMQTGNTVYVGLGVSGQPYSQPLRWVKSGTSILSFVIGSFFFSRLMRLLGPLRRSTLLVSSLLQAILTAIPAILSVANTVPPTAGDQLPHNLIVLLPLGLLAAQSGGQCVLSRVLGYGELPTVVLTSGYCDLAMDEKVFAGVKGNSKRNRRVAAMVMIVAGATVGGYMTKHGDIGRALWAVTGVKVVMAAAWLFWTPKEGRVRLP